MGILGPAVCIPISIKNSKRQSLRRMISESCRPITTISTIAVLLVLSHGGLEATAQEELSWQKEWERTVTAAKKEGQVSVYVGDWAAILDAGIFQKTYGIEIKGVDVGATNASRRILAERRAGKYIVDVVFAGSQQMLDLYRAKALDSVKPVFLLPDIVDESKWWQGKHWYMDHESQYTFRFAYMPNVGSVSYNTKLVSPKEFTSLWDFLNPKWKGKIIAFDPRAGGSANAAMRFFYHHPDLGPKFIRRLFGEMDVTLYRDRRQGPDWLALEKFAICFFCDSTELARASRQGLPVAKFGPMKEGGMVTSRHGIIGLINRAPHPNAARVFINWLLSREGQVSLLREVAKSGRSAPDSLRIDVPKDNVLLEDRRTEGIPYLELDMPGLMEMEPILKVVREIIPERR